MTNKEFDDKQQKYFDDMNSVGLGELILFSKSIVPFVEKESQRNKVMKVVTGICGYPKCQGCRFRQCWRV